MALLSELRNDLPPSAQALRDSGSPSSVLRKRDRNVLAALMKVLSLFAGRNQRSHFRQTRRRAARPSQSLFSTRNSLFALRRPCEKVPECEESDRRGRRREPYPKLFHRRGQVSRCRSRTVEARRLTAILKTRFRQRGKESRLAARWYVR